MARHEKLLVVHLDVLGGSPGVREDPLGTPPEGGAERSRIDADQFRELRGIDWSPKKNNLVRGGEGMGGEVSSSHHW